MRQLTFQVLYGRQRSGSRVVILAAALEPGKCRQGAKLIASPVSSGAYMPPVKEIRQCEEDKKCITRRHTLHRGRLIWHRQPDLVCIDIGEDISGKQLDGDPDNKPEAIIGTAIGQEGHQPHEVLRAEYLACHNED